MQTIVRAADAAEFLSVIPQLFGFRPTNSLAIVAFRGKRTCGALRLDLPENMPDRHLKRFLSQQLGTMCKISGIDGLATIVYTDEPFASDGSPPFTELVAACRTRATHMGLAVKDALCVAADGWVSYLESDAPSGGHSLADIPEVDLVLPGVARPVGDQRGPRDRPRPDLVRVERIGEACRRISTVVSTLEGTKKPCGIDGILEVQAREEDDLLSAALMPLQVPTPLFERALSIGAAGLTADEVALLLIAMRRPDLRDVALLQWAYGAEYGATALRGVDLLTAARARGVDGGVNDVLARRDTDDAEDDNSDDADDDNSDDDDDDNSGDDDDDDAADDDADGTDTGFAIPDPGTNADSHRCSGTCAGTSAFDIIAESARRLSGVGAGPDPDRVRSAIGFLLDIVDLAPLLVRPAPLTILSWLSWAIGRNTMATDFAARALVIDPEYGLATLMVSMFDHGRYPEWLFVRTEDACTP